MKIKEIQTINQIKTNSKYICKKKIEFKIFIKLIILKNFHIKIKLIVLILIRIHNLKKG